MRLCCPNINTVFQAAQRFLIPLLVPLDGIGLSHLNDHLGHMLGHSGKNNFLIVDIKNLDKNQKNA